MVSEMMVTADCVSPGGRLHRRKAFSRLTGDVLEHHDGVVDNEAGRDGKAIRVRLLRLYPRACITTKVPIKDSGTATLGMMVAEGCAERERSP